MPTQTYDLLASTVLTSDSAQASFTNLNTVASGYRDLVVVFDGRSSRTNSVGDDMQIYYNSLYSSNFSAIRILGSGGSYSLQTAGGASQIELSGIQTSLSGNTKNTVAILEILDFSQTNKRKTTLVRRNDEVRVSLQGERWNSTSAITTINFDLSSGNFVSGSSFYLYGIVG